MTDVTDIRGKAIRIGDLLRTPDFIGPRRKQFYLYHMVCWNKAEQHLEAVPCAELAIGRRGGRFWIRQSIINTVRGEIIDTIADYCGDVIASIMQAKESTDV